MGVVPRVLPRHHRAGLILVVATLAAMLAPACVPPETPPDPYGLRATLVDDGIRLDWSAPYGDATGYRVEWLTAPGGWEHLTTVPATTTVDSTIPDRSTRKYRVRAIRGDQPTPFSAVVKATYVELLLPVISVDTEDHQPVVSKDEYLDAHVEIDPNGSAFDAFSAPTRIKGRGNTTWGLPKKPYKLKLDDKASLFGMPEEKDWVLLANYSDRSQLRTSVAQTAGHSTDLAWTPSSVHVELVLNGEYLGVYQLTEQVEVKKNRLDITEMEPDDTSGEAVTGGYLLEIDGRLEQNDEPGFRTRRRVPIVIKEPEPAAPEQFDYIRDYLQDYEDALFGPDFADPVLGHRGYADVDSFIDWYIVEELVKNQDATFSSAYLHKDRSQPIRFGPLWDFDLSMGTDKGIVPTDPQQVWVNQPNKPWVNRYFEDPTFRQRLNERWDAHKADFDQLPAQLEVLGAGLQDAIANDAARWDYTLEQNDTPQFLADWLTTRIAWMDAYVDQAAAQ